MVEEKEIKITLVPRQHIGGETRNMYRVSCDYWEMNCGWGYTLEEAIRDFDKNNQNNQSIDLKCRRDWD